MEKGLKREICETTCLAQKWSLSSMEGFTINAKNDWENFGTLHCCLHVRGVVVHGSLIVLCLKCNHHVGMLTECNLSCLSPYL